MAKLGDIPVEKQMIAFNKFSVLVKKMNGPRIVMLRVYPGRGHESEHEAGHDDGHEAKDNTG